MKGICHKSRRSVSYKVSVSVKSSIFKRIFFLEYSETIHQYVKIKKIFEKIAFLFVILALLKIAWLIRR